MLLVCSHWALTATLESITSVLQMKNLRLRGVKKATASHQQVSLLVQDLHPSSRSQHRYPASEKSLSGGAVQVALDEARARSSC